MESTKQLHEIGQSLWLDNISRELLRNGTLRRYRDDLSITGLTSNPTIFDLAIRNAHYYDDSIRVICAASNEGSLPGLTRKSTRSHRSSLAAGIRP
jgi:transaldolase